MKTTDLELEEKSRDVLKAVNHLCSETEKLAALNDELKIDRDEMENMLTIIFRAIASALKH